MAEEKDFVLRSGSQFFQFLKIYGPFFSIEDQVIVHNGPIIIQDGFLKRIIDRGLDDDTITRLGKCSNNRTECRNNSVGKSNPFWLRIPAIPLLFPGSDQMPGII